MDLGHAKKYREWFERLHQSDQDEKFEYLKELRKQVEAGVLEKPFTRPPPKDQLVPFDQLVSNMSHMPQKQRVRESESNDFLEDMEVDEEEQQQQRVVDVVEKKNRKIRISSGDAVMTDEFYVNKNFKSFY